MKALIVDGEELFRLSMKEVVSVAASFDSILEAGNEHEFLSATARERDLGLVVLHPSSLATSQSGTTYQWQDLVRRLYPNCAIVTVHDEETATAQDGEQTVNVPRAARVGQMVRAVRRALKLPLEGFGSVSERPGRPDVRAALKGEDGEHAAYSDTQLATDVELERLSHRQRQILTMAADGLPNKEIAARLGIAEGTVKAHMHAIFKVLGVSNRTQAVLRFGAGGRPRTGYSTQNPARWGAAFASAAS